MSEKARILVVDDDVDVCESISEILKLENYSVTMAFSGSEALDCMEKESFDLILLDMKMPTGINGVLTQRKIREKSPDIPVVVITGVDDDLLKTALKEGAIAYVMKPFHFENLFNTVKKALRRS